MTLNTTFEFPTFYPVHLLRILVQPFTTDGIGMRMYECPGVRSHNETLNIGHSDNAKYTKVSCDLAPAPEGSWNQIRVEGGSLCSADSVSVYRTNECPMYGFVGLRGVCYPCSAVGGFAGQCPGGDRVLPMPEGQCVDLDENLLDCEPKEACLAPTSGIDCLDMATCPPMPVRATCSHGYANNPRNGDMCCSECAPGFRRVAGRCTNTHTWEGTSWWEGLSLTVMLFSLAALSWFARSESVAILPFVVQLFRLAQAVTLIAFDLEGQCTSKIPKGYDILMALLPTFTGLADYFYLDDHVLKRFLQQLVFALFYLGALLVVPVAVTVRARLAARQGRPAPDLVSPKTAAKRAVTLWFVLLFGTLGFIATGQWVCVSRGERRNGKHPTALNVIGNYGISPCGPKVSAYVMTCALGLGLLVLVVLVALLVARAVRKLYMRTDAADQDYLGLAFLYGHLKGTCVHWWVMDFVPVVCAVVLRSFVILGAEGYGGGKSLSTTGGWIVHLFFAGLVLAAAVAVGVKRPYSMWSANAGFITGCLSVVSAILLRVVLAQCAAKEEKWESAVDGADGREVLSLLALLFFVSTALLGLHSVIRSRASRGQIKFHAGYSVSLMEDTAADPDALAAAQAAAAEAAIGGQEMVTVK